TEVLSLHSQIHGYSTTFNKSETSPVPPSWRGQGVLMLSEPAFWGLTGDVDVQNACHEKLVLSALTCTAVPQMSLEMSLTFHLH
uniref:Uncharacterized protein n=1 Tax=Serinus canaria TaxID=9135 RepID=A0A8C9MN44_SERCA